MTRARFPTLLGFHSPYVVYGTTSVAWACSCKGPKVDIRQPLHRFLAALGALECENSMPIECRPSNLGSDIRCEVCGQGFLLYGDRSASQERNAIRAAVQQELRNQHNGDQHSQDGFIVNWESEAVVG